MADDLRAVTNAATYENVIAECPSCGSTNIFNRVSDLHTLRPIDFREVKCQRCNQPFSIGGDCINAAHEMLLFECHEFIQGKRYMQCVLTAAQAYEVFFSHFMYVQLLFRAFAKDESRDLTRLNTLIRLLYQRMKGLTFEPMRRLVLRMIVDGVAPPSLVAAEPVILAIPGAATGIRPVTRAEIDQMNDWRLKALLVKLLRADVNTLRNRVIHKDAYRPKEAEAKRVYREAREVLFGLTGRLQLGFDFEWYVNQPVAKR